jgi:hypothetical protein
MKNLISASGCLVLLVGLVGCGGDDDDELNMGKFCSTVGVAMCDRLISCGVAQSSQKSTCTDAFVEGCCKDDGSCNENPESASAEMALRKFMNDCSAAFSTHPCNQFPDNLPAACMSSARLLSSSPTPPRPVPATLAPTRDADHPYNMGRSVSRALLGR